MVRMQLSVLRAAERTTKRGKAEYGYGATQQAEDRHDKRAFTGTDMVFFFAAKSRKEGAIEVGCGADEPTPNL